MDKPIIRILVVDDFEPWRHFVLATLQEKSELQVIGEVSDGLEAVQKAQELQPNLIILDIGLPTLDGIEAARRILRHAPNSRILFMSENHSSDVVEEALRTGAGGFVLKSDAARELLRGVESVLQGRQFVSASLAAQVFSGTRYEAVHGARVGNGSRLAAQKVVDGGCHEAEFYPDDAALVNGFANFIDAALLNGNAVVAIANESHRTSLLQRTLADGVKINAAVEQGSCVLLDPHDILSKVMIGKIPDPGRCANAIHDLIGKVAKGAAEGRPRIAFCGECAPTLLAEGNSEAAIQLEHLWDQITKGYSADTLCGYLSSTFTRGEDISVLQRICGEHSRIIGAELAMRQIKND